MQIEDLNSVGLGLGLSCSGLVLALDSEGVNLTTTLCIIKYLFFS